MMLEGQAVAEALGVRFAIDVDKRIEEAADVGAHKTSMLQDLEQGRPMEIGTLMTAVTEPGHRRADARDQHGARPRPGAWADGGVLRGLGVRAGHRAKACGPHGAR